jgi:hypothetical protein
MLDMSPLYLKSLTSEVKKFTVVVVFLLLSAVSAIAQQTWYSLADGDWDKALTWTLDPSGAIYLNPGNVVPGATDNVVILSGRKVTVPDGIDPYNAPLRNISITCGTVTVIGELDLRASSGHTFTAVRGSGRILTSTNNFPTANWAHFTTKDQGEGTIVLQGAGFTLSGTQSFFNLEVNGTTLGSNFTIDRDLEVVGNLTITKGTLKLGGTATTVRNLTVRGNVNIQNSNAAMGVTSASGRVYHWMNVYGNFTNNGTVNFSTSIQFTDAANGAVKLKFLGTTNNALVCNNTTNLYRLFVDKGNDWTYSLKVSASATTNFKLYGPVSGSNNDAANGSLGWQRLPVVLANGTLELGTNVVIDRLGENIDGTEPNEMTIPASAQLYINGANVTTSIIPNSWEYHWKGATVYGKLKVSAGTFTTPQYTKGIRYATDGNSTPVVEMTGGTLNATMLSPYNSSSKFRYVQSGGVLMFGALPGQPESAPLFYLPEATHVFEMSGGVIDVRTLSTHSVSGVFVKSAEGNYNVSEGLLRLTENSSVLKVYSTVPFYNVETVNNGSGSNIEITNMYGNAYDASNPGQLRVLNNLTIASGTTLVDKGCPVFVAGDLTLNGTFTQTGQLYFNGGKPSVITNNSGSTFSLGGLNLYKDVHPTSGSFYSVSLAGANTIRVSGNVFLSRGRFDIGNKDVEVTGNIEIVDGDMTSSGSGSIRLTGSAQQTLKGADGEEQDFGRLVLNNTSAQPQIKLLSDVNAQSVVFLRNQIFYTAEYNLELESANYNAAPFSGGTWGTSCMFATSAKDSDGGLTIGFTVPNAVATLATFPVGTCKLNGDGSVNTLSYGPCAVKSLAAQNPASSGYFTVIPVNNAHPANTDPTKVLAYYWKSKVRGFTDLGNNKIRLEFTSSFDLKGWSVAFMKNNDWAIGTYKYKAGDKTLLFDFNATNGIYSNLIASDYSAGLDNGMGQIPLLGVKTYTSTNGQNWHSASWVDEKGNTNVGPPTAADIAIIPAGQIVTIAANTAVASQVQINGKLIVSHNTSGHAIKIISGTGHLAYVNNFDYGPNNIISGDHSQFCNSSVAIFEYSGSGNYNLPTSSASLPYYPNLHFSGTGTKSTPYNGNVKVNGNLYVDNAHFNVHRGDCKVTVAGDVIVNTGTLTLNGNSDPNNNYQTYIEGSLKLTGNGTIKSADSGNEFNIFLKGNVELANGSILNLSDSNRKGNLYFNGNNTATVSTLSGASTVKLYRFTIEKPSGSKVHFTTPFSLNGPAGDATKSLVLKSGECHLAHSSIDLTLSDGSTAFKIPANTTLRVDNGSTIKIGTSTSTSNTGIFLDGSLLIPNGGKVYCNQGPEAFKDNYIEYGTSGATLLVGTNSELVVGSQLRRSTTTDAGVINFIQEGNSTVTLGARTAPLANRGVFEILGASTLSQAANTTITLINPQASATKPALWINPDNQNQLSLGAGSSFAIGNGSTPASSVFIVYAGKQLRDLTIAVNATASIQTGTLALAGNLTVNGGLTANNYDVQVGGNLINNGAITPGNNTFLFNGSVAQSISGTATTTNFNNLSKTGASVLSLDGTTTVSVARDLTIGTGATLNTKTFALHVKRNVDNNGTTLSNDGNEGIVFDGAEAQTLSGSGVFATATIDNPLGVVTPVKAGGIEFTKALRLKRGVFDIGQNLIHFGLNASIVPVNSFSVTNMVQTNLSFTDNGIRKVLPAGTWTEASPYEYVVPIGSKGKYTPVTFKLTNNGNSTGSVRVKAADERHSSIVNVIGTDINEENNVLQYNWTIDALGITGFAGKCVMKGVLADARIENVASTSYTLEDYITARILFSSDEWNKNTEADYDESNGELNFYFTGTNDVGIDGDYTAGVKDCIPLKVATYISFANGNWTNANTWAVYNPSTGATGVAGENVPTGGPRGAIVYVNKVLDVTDNAVVAPFRTNLLADGVIRFGATVGHRLGDVFGTGRLVLESGTLPAAVYTSFFNSGGGTIEFAGSGDYTFLGGHGVVNHLVLSGSGNRNFPSNALLINGNFTFGSSGLYVNANSGYDIELAGNVSYQGGYFVPGNRSVVFRGTSRQLLNGTVPFTGDNAIYNLVLNNAAGLDIANGVEVKNHLTLSSGVVKIATGGSLYHSNTSGVGVVSYTPASYVDGLFSRATSSVGSYVFPVGKDGRYGEFEMSTISSGGKWGVEYFNTGASDRNSFIAPLKYVSGNEYWRVEAPSAQTAVAKLRWDANSGVNPDDANFRVVTSSNTDSWSETAYNTKSGNMSGGTVKTGVLSYGLVRRFTFGSTNIDPYTWNGAVSDDWFVGGNWQGGAVPSASNNAIIAVTSRNPVIRSGAVAMTNDLLLNATTRLTLDAGARMTINGNVTNNGEIVLVNTVDQPVSFWTKGTISNPINTKWTYPTGSYIAVGHCVDGNLYGNYGVAALYTLVNNQWSKVLSSTGFNDNPLMGYYLGFSSTRGATVDVSHTGTLRQGSYNLTMGTTWEMISNPYSTYIDVESPDFKINGAYNTVYVANRGIGAVVFATYGIGTGVAANGGSRYIAPGQSFYIRSIVNGTQFQIAPSVRTHGDSAPLKSASTNNDVLRLKLSNQSVADESVMVFRSIGSDVFSSYYDSEKRFTTGDKEVSLYTKKDGRNIIINALPEELEGRVVPLFVNVGKDAKGTMKLSASNIGSFRSDVDVYLYDKDSEETIDLRKNPEYQFDIDVASGDNRFELRFKSAESSSESGESTAVEASKAIGYSINAFGMGSKAVVWVKDSHFNGNVSIEVRDALGRLYLTKESVTERTEVDVPVNTQFYIVKVVYRDRVQSFKMFGNSLKL